MPAQVFDAAGIGPDAATIVAPTRHVGGEPAQIVHLVVVGHRPADTDWIPLDHLDAPVCVRQVIRLDRDEWTGRKPRPTNLPAWYAPGWTAEADDWIDDRLAEVWSEGYSRAAVNRMLEQAPLLDRVYQMISYEGIYRSREPASLWEMRGIVALSLRQLIERWRA